ncbi:GntR family transcriptional regulator [Streptomyces gramineus]|uniref:hypothetical protein n=1 Tax=Streptomyces gramineus TaxID=910542 RepID=UPI00398B50CE
MLRGSRTPVREALLLAAEDLVRLVPERCAQIVPRPGRGTTGLMETRGIVGRYAAEQVMSSGNGARGGAS